MKKVAVCLQLYHTDLWPEFEKLLSPLANNIKLYLALCQDNNFTYDLSSFDHHISYHPNYGADIAPFLHQLNLVKEDLFIKVHGKKSKFGENNHVNWRSILLNDFFSSKEIFFSNIDRILLDDKCGIICNESFLLKNKEKESNSRKIKHLCKILNLDYSNFTQSKFAAGTMFMGRTKTFKNKLVDHIDKIKKLLKNEKGKVEESAKGTYSHSMERILGFMVAEQGLKFCHPPLKKIKILNELAPNKKYFNLVHLYDGSCYIVESPNIFGYFDKNTKDIVSINWHHIKDKIVNQAYRRLSEDAIIKANDYDFWRIRNAPNADSIQKMRLILKSLTYSKHKNILFSIVMPVYNTPANFLVEAIDSVLAQVYPHWELCIVDDASSDPDVKDILESYRNKDSRIKVFYSEENKHISHASNLALSMASGEFVVFLDHDDTLSEDALYELFLALNSEKEIDMIYSDEDKIDPNGNYIDPFFKPEWSPDSFLSKMYTCHLSAYRRSIVNELGGLREGFEGSQDWDLMLRFTEKTQKIVHIPKVLYHWRIHDNSTAAAGDAKSYAHIASKKAIDEALVRRGEIGQAVNPDGYNGHYNIRYVIKEHKKVSIIISTKDLGDMLDQCLTSIFTKTIYPNYEVLVIDNNSVEEKTDQVILKWRTKEPNRFKVEKLNIPFNFSAINNYAVSQCDGDYLLFLNNDTEVINNDWLNAMIEQAQRPSIGAVGALLLFSDETIQHAGVIMGLGGVAGHAYYKMPSDMPGYFGNLIGQNNVSAVTAACLMCRRDVFDQVGGFDEQLAVAYNDVDLCLKMLDKGYRNIYIPTAKLYHHESKTRGYEDSPEKKQRLEKEAEILKTKWQKYIDNDPYYSPHLTRTHQNYNINLTSSLQKEQIFENIWKDLNQLGFLDETNPQYHDQISLKETSVYFNPCQYKIITLDALTAEDKDFLKENGLMISNLELIRQDNDALEKTYNNSCVLSQEKIDASQKTIKPDCFQQTIVETGYAYAVDPFSGQIIRSNQSFYCVSWLPMFIYRFVGGEVFYLVTGHFWNGKIFLYFPRLELIIKFYPGNLHMVNYEGIINYFKSYMVSYWQDVQKYISTPEKKIASVLGVLNHMGHYLWNDLTGIQYLYENEILQEPDVFLVGASNFLDVGYIFPEIPADKIQKFNNNLNLFEAILKNNYMAVRVTDKRYTDKLEYRLYKNSLTRCSESFLQDFEKAKQHFPLLCIQIRNYRTWISQISGIANIIRELHNNFPNLGIVFDGWSLLENEDQKAEEMINKEKQIVEKILKELPESIGVYNIIGSKIYKKIVWHKIIDAFVASMGSGVLFLTLIANKPGVIHGNNFFVQPYHQEELKRWRKDLLMPIFISPKYIMDDESDPDHILRNYNCDWEVIYEAILTLLKELNPDQPELSPVS